MRLTTDVRRSNEMTQRDEHQKKEIVNSFLALVRCMNIVAIRSIQFLASSKCLASIVI